MIIGCPRCSSASMELVECENCKVIGCIKCMTKHGGRWLCQDCRSGNYSYERIQTETKSPESALAAMFG